MGKGAKIAIECLSLFPLSTHFRMRTFLYLASLLLLLVSCRPYYSVRASSGNYYHIPCDSLTGFDSSAYLLTQPYRTAMESRMNRLLARSAQVMEKGQPESILGNFVADLCFERVKREEKYRADFCVLNNGGLRSSLPEGDIHLRNVYELMPFDNTLVILELTGETTLKLLDYIARRGGVPVANLRMSIMDDVPRDVSVGGLPFDDKNHYRVLTSDYLAGGGDSMEMFKEAVNTVTTGIPVRDAIISHLEERGKHSQPIIVNKDGRIVR